MVDKCKFCEWEKHYDKVYENKHAVAVWGSPYVKGHIKVIIKRHADNLTDLTSEEGNALFELWKTVGKAVERVLKPDIINWQINGNWVRHVHGHIYPRWKEDKDWGEPIQLPTSKQDKSKDYDAKSLSDVEVLAIKKILE